MEVFPHPFRMLLSDFDFSLSERKATCEDCRMARSAGGFAYKAELKCCTYFPFLYNFQVGAILCEETISIEIRNRLKNFICTNQAQPLGVAPDFDYQKKFTKRGVEAFGRDAELLCPYFDKEHTRCGIWNWRGGVCTSFYCESSYGLKGIEFWRDLEKYFLVIENSLGFDALLNIGFNEFEAKSCLQALPKLATKPFKFQNDLWRELGDERVQVFEKSYSYVMSLSKQSFQKLIGEETLQIQQELYRRALELACKSQ